MAVSGASSKRLHVAGKHLVLLALSIATLAPFVILVNLSFKDNAQFIHYTWGISFPFRFGNYVEAWTAVGKYIINSVVVTGTVVIGTVMLSAFTAFVFARFKFPGREFLFYMILSLLMIPGVLTLIPLFVLVKTMGLLNNLAALIFPGIAGGQVFGVFLLRSFFATIPEELFEAARIDGATDLQAFVKIGMPMCVPSMITLAIMNVVGTWNDLIWPMIVLSDERLMTITVGLSFFRVHYYTVWGPLFAGYVIGSVPLLVLFVFTSKYFVRGLVQGALKA